MDYRKTSQGDLISTMGIGSSHMHEISPEGIQDLLDYGSERGVNLLDLAMSYPEPLEDIGKALNGKRDKFFLQMHLGLTFPKGRYLGVASHMADICHRFIETGGIDACMFSVNAAYDLDPVDYVPFDELDVTGQDSCPFQRTGFGCIRNVKSAALIFRR